MTELYNPVSNGAASAARAGCVSTSSTGSRHHRAPLTSCKIALSWRYCVIHLVSGRAASLSGTCPRRSSLLEVHVPLCKPQGCAGAFLCPGEHACDNMCPVLGLPDLHLAGPGHICTIACHATDRNLFRASRRRRVTEHVVAQNERLRSAPVHVTSGAEPTFAWTEQQHHLLIC
jgi:hypothetical protein